MDLNSNNRGCARLGSGVAPPLGVVEEEVAVLIALVRRHRRAVGAAVHRAVGYEVPGAVEEVGLEPSRGAPCAFRPSGCAACTCPWCACFIDRLWARMSFDMSVKGEELSD